MEWILSLLLVFLLILETFANSGDKSSVEYFPDRSISFFEINGVVKNSATTKELGNLFFNEAAYHLWGQAEESNWDKGIENLLTSAKYNNAQAMVILSTFHSAGIFGFQQNQIASTALLELAYKQGDIMAQMGLAFRHLLLDNCENAAGRYNTIARLFVQTFQQQMGQDSGILFDVDDTNFAVDDSSSKRDNHHREYYRSLADGGNPQGLMAMGQLNLHGGMGVERNPQEALHNFEAAAPHDHHAHTFLGHMYAEGNGVEKNMELAREHYQIAADGELQKSFFLCFCVFGLQYSVDKLISI
eukprot:TRINITY_DN3443_c0_g3_i3.p1 TRINITY_DN3443_c0_g3~~TRINITY_DN3443_c0_g3_i3.p1  ORF type:complete len:301 (-),score=70.51 TRINITY_DN3443_c0_g3_i3:48-950(-)